MAHNIAPVLIVTAFIFVVIALIVSARGNHSLAWKISGTGALLATAGFILVHTHPH